MNIEQILKVLKNERECITRQNGKCDRNCKDCDLCLPDTEILEVYDFLINGYELLQNQGAEKYVLRCDTSKLSEAEKTRLRLIENERFAAPTLTAQIKPLSPDALRKIMGMESTD